MLGIPGTGYLESFIPDSALGQLDQITSLLGLDSGNAPALLMLGSVKFSLNTAAIREGYSRTAQARWASVPRLWARDDLQYTGPASDIYDIPCVIYGKWKQKNATLDTLHTMMTSGHYYNLIDIKGSVLGIFVISEIRSDYSYYSIKGDPDKISFNIVLRKYDDVYNQTKNRPRRNLLERVVDAVIK